jgi:hypothetical protein
VKLITIGITLEDADEAFKAFIAWRDGYIDLILIYL